MDKTYLWEQFLILASQRISKLSYESWVAPSKGSFSDGSTLTIEVQNDFAKDWIDKRYRQIFLAVLKEITGKEYNLKVITNSKRQACGGAMKEEQAMGYFMLACKDAGLPYETVKQLHSNILSKFDSYTPHEAESGGIGWLDTLKQENNQDKSVISPKDLTRIESLRRPPTRSALNLKLPNVSESNTTKRIRAQNRRIIKELEYAKKGPFGLYELFRRCKK